MDGDDLLVINEPDRWAIGSPYAISRLLHNDVAAQEVAVAEYLEVRELASNTTCRTRVQMQPRTKGSGISPVSNSLSARY